MNLRGKNKKHAKKLEASNLKTETALNMLTWANTLKMVSGKRPKY